MFADNIGEHLSIDETAFSKGELYTIITNKKFKGKKRSLVAIIKGTKSAVVSNILVKIPVSQRMKVREVTLDMANSMDWIVRANFPNARKITDRFHVQQLVSEALQTMRIKERWKAIDEESNAIIEAKKNKIKYSAFIYSNGDTKKQLLARSRYLLFKPTSKWNESQKTRADILFKEFPKLKEGYILSMNFRAFYEYSKGPKEAKQKLKNWYKKIEEKKFPSFISAANSVKVHEGTILNYFYDRRTNASAESFNAKLKGFRSILRGVRDISFFMFRLSKIYA